MCSVISRLVSISLQLLSSSFVSGTERRQQYVHTPSSCVGRLPSLSSLVPIVLALAGRSKYTSHRCCPPYLTAVFKLQVEDPQEHAAPTDYLLLTFDPLSGAGRMLAWCASNTHQGLLLPPCSPTGESLTYLLLSPARLCPVNLHLTSEHLDLSLVGCVCFFWVRSHPFRLLCTLHFSCVLKPWCISHVHDRRRF